MQNQVPSWKQWLVWRSVSTVILLAGAFMIKGTPTTGIGLLIVSVLCLVRGEGGEIIETLRQIRDQKAPHKVAKSNDFVEV